MTGKKLLRLLSVVLGVFSISFIGSIVNMQNRQWYDSLTQPALVPPDWVFGVVWTILYIMIGVSVFLILEKGSHKHFGFKIALLIFFIQLFLNGAWSIIFFGFQNIYLALITIVLLWTSIIWLIMQFYVIDKRASWLLIPYFMWVTFATYLNFAYWILNF